MPTRKLFPAPAAPVNTDHYDGSASITQYAANTVWPVGEMSIFAQFYVSGQNGANNNYVFSTVDANALNGVRLNYLVGGSGGFAADSTNTAQAPNHGPGITFAVDTFYTWAVSWDGSLSGSNILNYLGIGGEPLKSLSGNPFDGTGSLKQGTGQPVTIGGRQGGTNRIMLGDQAVLAWWNRILSLDDFLRVQRSNPLAVPAGLVLCQMNGVDIGPYRWVPTSRSSITPGAPNPYACSVPKAASLQVRGFPSAPTTFSGGGQTIGVFG